MKGDSVAFPYRAGLRGKKLRCYFIYFSPISWGRDIQHEADIRVSELTHNKHKFTMKENYSLALAQLPIMANKNKLLQHILPCSPKILLLPQNHGSCLFLFNPAAYSSLVQRLVFSWCALTEQDCSQGKGWSPLHNTVIPCVIPRADSTAFIFTCYSLGLPRLTSKKPALSPLEKKKSTLKY